MADMNKILCNVQQNLSEQQKSQARQNIGVVASCFSDIADGYIYSRFAVIWHASKLYMANKKTTYPFNSNDWDEVLPNEINKWQGLNFANWRELESVSYNYGVVQINPYLGLGLAQMNFGLVDSINSVASIFESLDEGPYLYGAGGSLAVGYENTGRYSDVDFMWDSSTGKLQVRLYPNGQSNGVHTVSFLAYMCPVAITP